MMNDLYDFFEKVYQEHKFEIHGLMDNNSIPEIMYTSASILDRLLITESAKRQVKNRHE